MKNQVTHKVLVEGKLEHRLHVYNPSKLILTSTVAAGDLYPSINLSVHRQSCNRTSSNNTFVPYISFFSSQNSDTLDNFSLWHNRLGHPAIKTAKNVLSLCYIHMKMQVILIFAQPAI